MPTPKKRAYSARDMLAVSDNPEWTKADFAKAKPFAEALPDLAVSLRKGRGPNKAATKKLVSLRLSPDVLDYFKATGRGWQTKIDDTLRKAARLKG